MKEDIAQIAQRLQGLRDALDVSTEEMAVTGNVSIECYNDYESGKTDIPVGFLKQIASKYNVDLTTLLFDDEPRMSNYFLTRKGKGLAFDRVAAYKYQSLSAGFAHRKADVFTVTVEPKLDEITPIHLNTHEGQEFNLVTEGRLLIQINEKEFTLSEGDSLYFDSTQPHGMKALDGKRATFIAMIM